MLERTLLEMLTGNVEAGEFLKLRALTNTGKVDATNFYTSCVDSRNVDATNVYARNFKCTRTLILKSVDSRNVDTRSVDPKKR